MPERTRYPPALLAHHGDGTSLDVCVARGPEVFFLGLGGHAARQAEAPYLDVSAIYQADGVVLINVVNRHLERAVAIAIVSEEGVFDGPFEVYEVNGANVGARNAFCRKVARKPNLNAGGPQLTCTFPPHSFTMLKGTIRR